MDSSADSERLQLEEDIRQIDEALHHDNEGELSVYGSDLDDSGHSEDEAAEIHPGFDDEQEDISQQPSTSGTSNLGEFDLERITHEEADSDDDDDDDDDEEPSIQQLLILNKRYQEFIVSNLRNVQDALEKNRLMQVELLENKRRDRGNYEVPSKVTPPYFKDKNFLFPPSNEEAVAISKKGYPMPVNPQYPRIWSKQELSNLKKGVKADGLERMMWPLLNQREVLEGKLKTARDQGDRTSRKALVKEISDIDSKLEELKKMPEERVLGDLQREVDWNKVANRYLEGNRTAVECQLKWQNYTHPQIRHEWTAEDDKLLKVIARVHGAKNWKTIATEMGRGFSEFECLQRYQQKLNDDLYKRPYTEAEDNLLIQLVERFRIGDQIPWIKVAYFLKDRKDKQCSHRWLSKLDPSIRNGKWTDTEDKILLAAVKKYKGRNWTKVCLGIPGRSAQQCRNRWTNVLNPNLRKGRFSSMEDMVLLEAVKQSGRGHWSRIKAIVQKSPDFLPGRSTAMLTSRYRYLSLQRKDKMKKEYNAKQAKFRKACIEQSMTSLVGDTQNALFGQREETFEEYCSKFTKEELLDDMIQDAKKRVTDLGEKANWTNLALPSGFAYQVNREKARIWKKSQKAAKELKKVPAGAVRIDARYHRSGNVLASDPKQSLNSLQNEQVDLQLIKAVFPSRTLQPNEFFEKKGKIVNRLARSEYITSELNKKKPLSWGTAVLVLMKVARVDLFLCKGIIHRSARLPNINIVPEKRRNLQEAPKYRTLATAPGGRYNNRPFPMMLTEKNAPEMICGQVIGHLPGASESNTPAKKRRRSVSGARSSEPKQKDPRVNKQSNPVFVVKTNDERLLLVTPGTSTGTGSPSLSGPLSPNVGSRAGNTSDALGVTTLPKRMSKSKGQAVIMGTTVETNGLPVSTVRQESENVPREASLSLSSTRVPSATASKTKNSVTPVRIPNQVTMSGSFPVNASSVSLPKKVASVNDAAENASVRCVTTKGDEGRSSKSGDLSEAARTSANNNALNKSGQSEHQRKVTKSSGLSVRQQIEQATGMPFELRTHVVNKRPSLAQGLNQPATRVSTGMTVSQLIASKSLPNIMVVPSGSSQLATSSIPVRSDVKQVLGGNTGQKVVKVNPVGQLKGLTKPGVPLTGLLPSSCVVSQSPGQHPQTVIVLVRNSSDPSATASVVTSMTTLPTQSIGQPTPLVSNLPQVTSSSVASHSTTQNSLPQSSSSPLRQNQVSGNLSGVISNIQQMTDTPGSLVNPITSPVRKPPLKLVTPLASSEVASLLSGLAVSSTFSAQTSPSIGLNRAGGTNQSLVVSAIGTSVAASRNEQGSALPKSSGLETSSSNFRSGVIFSPQVPAIKRRQRKKEQHPDPTINPKMVIGVAKKPAGKTSGSIEVVNFQKRSGQNAKISHPAVNKENENGKKSVSDTSLPLSKPCDDGVHCGTDDDEDSRIDGEEEGSLRKKAKMTHGPVALSGSTGSKPCSDGVHCGTDDEEDDCMVERKGEDSLQKKAGMTQWSVAEGGKNSTKHCSDRVHCGTDDEGDGAVRGKGSLQTEGEMASVTRVETETQGGKLCSDGIHCGSDDEDDGTSGGSEGDHQEKAKMIQGSVAESGKNGSNACSDGVHCGTDDEEDGTTGGVQGDHQKKVEMMKGSVAKNGNKSGNVCSDGIHCGTDDEEEGTANGIERGLKSPETQEKKDKSSSKPCSDGIHCGTDEDDNGQTKTENTSSEAQLKVTAIPLIEDEEGGRRHVSQTCSDGVHCGTDDEEDGTTGGAVGHQKKKVKMMQGSVAENGSKSGNTCSDGVHCGTNDEEEDTGNGTKDRSQSHKTQEKKDNSRRKSCSDGIHCGTDDDEDDNGQIKDKRASSDAQVKVTTIPMMEEKGERHVSKTCSDGVHCGTDDEDENDDSAAESTENGKKPENPSRAEKGDGSCSTRAKQSNEGSEVATIQGDVSQTLVSAVPSSGGGGDDGGPSPVTGKLDMPAKRPRREAAPKPGSFVMSSTEDDEDSDSECRIRKSSKAKKLKSSRPEIAKGSPNVVSSHQGPSGQLSANLSQSLTSPVVFPAGSPTTPSLLNVGGIPLPLLGATTPVLAPQSSVLVGPGGVILGVLPGTSPAPQLLQNSGILPQLNTLPNLAIQQPPVNNALITSLPQQPNVILQQPLGTTVNQSLTTLQNVVVPPVSSASSTVQPSSVSVPVQQQSGGTSTRSNVTVPSNLLQNTLNSANSIAVPVISSLKKAASPVVSSPATSVPVSLSKSSVVTPRSQSRIVIHRVLPQGRTSVNHVSNLTSVVTSAGPVNSLHDKGSVVAPNKLLSDKPSLVIPSGQTSASTSVPALQQPQGTTTSTSVAVPSNLLQNTMNRASGMVLPNQSPVIMSLTSAASPVVQSAVTPVLASRVIPQGQTLVNQVFNLTNALSLAGGVNNLHGVGNVVAASQLTEGISSGVGILSNSSAVPANSVLPQQLPRHTGVNVVPPQSPITAPEMPSGDPAIHPSDTKEKLSKGKKPSKSVFELMKEFKLKPHTRTKSGMLPQLMKEDQYTVNHNNLEEFSGSILGTPKINFEKEMPMLPPNLATLFSFKHLLIKKISLEDSASKFSMTLGDLRDLHNSTILNNNNNTSHSQNFANAETPITKEQFLMAIKRNPLYTLFKERFTMLFLWPAYLSILKPFTPRKRRSAPKRKAKRKLGKEENRQPLLSVIQETSELDRSVNGGEEGGETGIVTRRQRVRRNGKGNVSFEADNSNSTPKRKFKKHKVICPQLPTRRGTRSTPLRKKVAVKETSVTEEMAAVSESKEDDKESPVNVKEGLIKEMPADSESKE